MILSIGEILFDIFPGYRRLGGAPFNFAFHLKQLGLPVSFVSRIGADENGLRLLKELQQMNFDTSRIQIDKRHPTGEVRVSFDAAGEPVFNIVKNTAYDYINFEHPEDVIKSDAIDLFYFGSLVQRSQYGFTTIQKMLTAMQPDIHCLYDVNLRPACYNRDIVIESMKKAHLLKINEAELQTVKQMLGQSQKNDTAFIEQLINQYHIEMLALTKGAAGSAIYTPDRHVEQKAPQGQKEANPVGAGDAYAAILAIGYLQKWPVEKIISTATEFSARICEIDSAFSTDPSFYDTWRSSIAGEAH